MLDPRIAKLKAALDAGVIDEETYRAALAALPAPGDGVTVNGNVDAGRDFVGRDQINITSNRYAGSNPTDDAEQRRIYLRYLVQTLSTLPLGAFDLAEAGAGDDSAGDDSAAIQLDNVFIGLETTTQVKRVFKHEDANVERLEVERLEMGGREETRALRIIEAISDNVQIVVTGEPGSGKSTVTNYVMLAHAQQRLGAGAKLIKPFTEDWHAKLGLAPLRVILRDFEVWLATQDDAGGPALLWDFIAHTLREQNLVFAAPWLLDELEKREALLVLDGLDEISTNAMRLRVRQAIEDFAARYAGNRFVVTCRTLSYQEPDSGQPELRLNARTFPAFQIAELTDAMIADFTEAWQREVRRESKIKNDETQKRLQEALGTALQQDDLRRLARNPLQLTLMAWVHTDSNELADKRAKLYDRAIDLLLWKWETKKQYRSAHATLSELAEQAPNGRDEIVSALGRAAYEAHAALTDPSRDALAAIDEMALLRDLARLNPDQLTGKGDMGWASEVIDALKTRSGLLAHRGENKLTLPHRSFQEYLAGVYMLEDADFVGLVLEHSRDLTLWREPILLATDYNVNVQKRRDLALPLTLARRLCDDTSADEDLRWKRVWLAGEVLREIGIEDAKAKEASTYTLVQEKLTTLVSEGKLRPVERARAGLLLAQLGDPRFDPEHWHLPVRNEPLLGFVNIPDGEVYMGTAASDFHRQMALVGIDKSRADEYYTDEENPAQSPNTVERFLIARYPTTVAQFRTFVIATGRDNESAAIALSEPATAPVRNVTWHDAMAYCAWLNEQLKQAPDTPEALRALLTDGGYRVTLPSEVEWERAARGDTPTRPLFPWGDDVPGTEANDFANVGYSEIDTTCIVGAFPRGRSSFGVHDMVGNVWEWTRSNYDRPDPSMTGKRVRFDYPYESSDGREITNAPDDWSRSRRGGAFFNLQNNTRVAARDRFHPVYSYIDIGFRVSVSPTSR